MTGGLVWLTLVAFVLSAGTTVAMMKAGTRLGLLDEPGAHRSHDSTTPRAGGVGIAAALVAVLARDGLHLIAVHAPGIDDKRAGIASLALVREDVDVVD